MPLIIILAEAGLELVPDEIKSEKISRKNYDPSYFPSMILDNAIYHTVMNKLSNAEKRGRPDIVHQFLLNSLGSPLNKEGLLQLYIHTANNEIFKINPQLQILRNYERFKGLMAKLLIERKILSEIDVLISEYTGGLKDLIKKLNPDRIFLFSSKGKLNNNPISLFPSDPTKKTLTFIGGFQKGMFNENILSVSDNLISLYHEPLDSWIVLQKIITFYEIAIKLYDQIY